jgi:hypothetical protein
MGRDDTSRPATRRIGQLSGERDVTGVVESMKPRCRFRRREVAARETGAVFVRGSPRAATDRGMDSGTACASLQHVGMIGSTAARK